MSDVLEKSPAAQLINWSQIAQSLQHRPTEQEKQSWLTLALETLESGDFQDRWEVAKVLPNFGETAIAPLIALIADEETDWEHRWFVARILGEFDTPEAISALAEVLKTSDHEELSSIAAGALAKGNGRAINTLIELLDHPISRPYAATALTQVRRSEIIEPMLEILQDKDPSIRAAAIATLSSFRDPRIPKILVAAIADPAAAVRKEAAIALGLRPHLNKELDLVNVLKPLLRDVRLEVCAVAASALGRLKTDAAAAVLFELLQAQTTPVPLKIEVIRALAWTETAVALDYLQWATNHEPAPLVQEIATVLGRVERPGLREKAVEILISLLENERLRDSVAIKQMVAISLGRLGDERAIHPLIHLLADADRSVYLHSLTALQQLMAGEMKQYLEQFSQQYPLTPALHQGITLALQELGIGYRA